MVMRANQAYGELGGHIASYASAAEIFEVGFNHFFRARTRVRAAIWCISSRIRRRGVRARLSGGQAQRRPARQVSPGSAGRWAVFLPASVADAGILAVSHGSMGIGPISAIYQRASCAILRTADWWTAGSAASGCVWRWRNG